jgi:Predicted solute binding protein
VTDTVDVVLVGKSRLDYGEQFNESLVHLLENFSCPARPGFINEPDLTLATGTLLSNPVGGQKWFNQTNKRTYLYNKILEEWEPLANGYDIAGNSGILAHGEFIPRPLGVNGYLFPYSECSFSVSQHSVMDNAGGPAPTVSEIDYMRCFVSNTGLVTVQFRYRGESTLRNGYANYAIIGIADESNAPYIEVTPYVVPSPTPLSSQTPTPAPTNTPTPTPAAPSATPTSTPAPQPSSTPGVTVTPTPAAPTPSPTKTPLPSPGVTPSPTPTKTPAPTPGVSVSPTMTPTPTPTVTPTITLTKTPTPTPTVTPTKTPTPTPTPSLAYTIDVSMVPATLISVVAPTNAWAFITFKSDGTWATDIKPSVYNTSGTYLSSGVGSNYEFYYTFDGIGVEGVIGPPEGTWLSLGSDVTVGANDAHTETSTDGTIYFTIRHKINTADSRSGSIYLSVDGECFMAGTQLRMADGNLRNVEDLILGDAVASFTHPTILDESVAGWQNWSSTENLFGDSTSAVNGVKRFTATDAVVINGVTTTINHIYLIHRDGSYKWEHARNVTTNDKLVNKDKELVDILNIERVTGSFDFVTIDVETNDTLVVAYGDELILSHNASA